MNLLWLRRDLRLHDNPALAAAAKAGLVQPVFVFDTDVLQCFPNPRDRRVNFLMRRLAFLHEKLAAHGAGILVVHGRAVEVIPALKAILGAHEVHAAEDYEPPARTRDEAVTRALRESFCTHKDHMIFSPTEVLKDSGEPFKVYTPYSKQWRAKLSLLATAPYDAPTPKAYANYAENLAKAKAAGLRVIDLSDAGDALRAIGYEMVEDELWTVNNARERLRNFVVERGRAYATERDYVYKEGVSRISPYLRFGLISVREAVALALEHGAEKWLSELIWREFYMMILTHAPESQTMEWNPAYRGLAWRSDAEELERWKQGKTGFPVVDAAMRQLLAEGWMHNRARMIVASFLTKDLQMDWRLGEEHFAQYLMDYEMSSNVGGWQWAASTGTDAQPYFRVFNPYLQSKKFDPEGIFIRRYVPELRGVMGDAIHEPPAVAGYPAPMVDHKLARERAIAMFKTQ